MAECSTPHGGETGRRGGQVYGGRGSEGAGGSGTNMGGEVVDGLKCKQENLFIVCETGPGASGVVEGQE